MKTKYFDKTKMEKMVEEGLLCQHLILKMWTKFPVIEVNRGNIIHVIVVNLQLPHNIEM